MEPLMSRTDVRLWWLPYWCLFMLLLLVLLHQPPCSDRLGRCNVAFTALDIPKCLDIPKQTSWIQKPRPTEGKFIRSDNTKQEVV